MPVDNTNEDTSTINVTQEAGNDAVQIGSVKSIVIKAAKKHPYGFFVLTLIILLGICSALWLPLMAIGVVPPPPGLILEEETLPSTPIVENISAIEPTNTVTHTSMPADTPTTTPSPLPPTITSSPIPPTNTPLPPTDTPLPPPTNTPAPPPTNTPLPPTNTPPPPTPIVLKWEGVTEQGLPITFEVREDGIGVGVFSLQTSFDYGDGCPLGIVSFTALQSGHIFPDGSFSILNMTTNDARASVEGVFTSTNDALGNLSAYDQRSISERSNRDCSLSTTISWSASNVSP